MIRVTAYPTVEWLNQRSFGDEHVNLAANARSIHHSSYTSHSQGAGFSISPGIRRNRITDTTASIVSRLSRWKDQSTGIESSSWISTPDGEQLLDLVVTSKGRRVGYRFSAGYERNVQQDDALALVYGKLEALYRVQLPPAQLNPADLACLIVSMNPSWFTSDGRIRAGRVASVKGVQAAGLLKRTGSVRFNGMHVLRRRITRAGEWVTDFERALGLPDFRTYVSGRAPMKENRPSRKLTRRPAKRGSVKG